MRILINPLETAEEFAHAAVKHEFLDYDAEREEHIDEASLYLLNADTSQSGVYRADVQDAYNRHFDYYFEILTNNNKAFDHKRAYQEKKIQLIVDESCIELMKIVATVYFNLGQEPIYEVNGLFYILKLKENEE